MIYVLILLGGLFRLIPHLPNFTPVNAIGLFGGKYLDRKTAVISIILIMLLSDFFIGFYDWRLMLVVYLSLAVSGFIGQYLKSHFNVKNLALAIFLASGFFFLTTNFGVWLWGGIYPHSFGGLFNCYIMGLPFYRNMLLGDIVYTGGLFGVYEFLRKTKLVKIQKIFEF